MPWYEKAFNSVSNFWGFLNGKKNKIGNAALGAYGLAQTAVAMNLIPDHTLVAQAVLYAGVAFKVIGLSHKAVKGEFNNDNLPEGIR